MCWTGAALSSSASVSQHQVAASRSSENTRTLIKPCALKRGVDSFWTAGVSPSPPTITTGSRWWASARCAGAGRV